MRTIDPDIRNAVNNCFNMIALAAATALKMPDHIDDAIEVIDGQLGCLREFLEMEPEAGRVKGAPVEEETTT